MQAIQFVHSAEALPRALDMLADSKFVALDTEFMRESTYYPKLCLVQLATMEHCAVIDPLAVADLGALWSFLADHGRLKVLHAARQDLEVLAVDALSTAPLGPIFDTQIAAALLGQSAQIGYGPLVTQRLGHTLPKGHTRTDWSRRPLSEAQLEYAADDVRYLAPLYVSLRDELDSCGRSQWLAEETRELERLDINKTQPENAWSRLKGLDRLRPEQRATAKLLARWREELAMRHDKPRGWILADEALREISERMPTNLQQLEQIRSLPPGVVRKRAEEILNLVARGEQGKQGESDFHRPSRPEPAQLALVTRLLTFVRGQAHGLRISPEILATRKDIEQLVFSGNAGRLGRGWREEVLGDRLQTLANAHD